ncbi:mechanosensitive ion channel [Vibrio lentus]|nr:mechanosensitive ion channel [Vibrio lentus]
MVELRLVSCVVMAHLGTIESIGYDRRRIRTLERSLITIPNSEFANMEIDNLERRDKRRMDHRLKLRSELTQDQLKVACGWYQKTAITTS